MLIPGDDCLTCDGKARFYIIPKMNISSILKESSQVKGVDITLIAEEDSRCTTLQNYRKRFYDTEKTNRVEASTLGIPGQGLGSVHGS